MARKSDLDGVTSLAVSVPRGAAMVDVSDRHMWAEIKAGRIRTVRSGSRVLIPIDALKEYLKPEADSPAPQGEHAQVIKREKKPRIRR